MGQAYARKLARCVIRGKRSMTGSGPKAKYALHLLAKKSFGIGYKLGPPSVEYFLCGEATN